jgi:hypothetical protein
MSSDSTSFSGSSTTNQGPPSIFPPDFKPNLCILGKPSIYIGETGETPLVEATQTKKASIFASAKASLKLRSWKKIGVVGGLAVGGIATLAGAGLIVAGTLTADPLMVLAGTITAVAGAAIFLISLIAAVVIACKNRRARRRAAAAALIQPPIILEQPSPNILAPTGTGSTSLLLSNAILQKEDDDDGFDEILTLRGSTRSPLPSNQSIFNSDQDQNPTSTSSSSSQGFTIESSLPNQYSLKDAKDPINLETESLLTEYFSIVDASLNDESAAKLEDSTKSPNDASTIVPDLITAPTLNLSEIEDSDEGGNISDCNAEHPSPTSKDLSERVSLSSNPTEDLTSVEPSSTSEERIQSVFGSVVIGNNDLPGRISASSSSTENLTGVFTNSVPPSPTENRSRSEEEYKTQGSVSPSATTASSPSSRVDNTRVLLAFENLMRIKTEASEGISQTSFGEIMNLKTNLPEALQKEMHSIEWTSENLIKFVDDVLDLKESVDKGGHGGTMRAKVTLDNQTYFLFLKPLDEVESRNYTVINHYSPEISAFMPKIYGITTVNGTSYMMMENTRMTIGPKDEDGNPVDPRGVSLEQLADIKLAGKVDGLDNPIANQDEMHTTRGKYKNVADYQQMKAGALSAPNYMVVPEGSKFTRIFGYKNSQENLRALIKNAGLTLEQINKLKDDLNALKSAMISSPFAFIGASVIFVTQEDGSLKPILIDPAHVQLSRELFGQNALVKLVGRDSVKLYFGDDNTFSMQRQSNNIALDSLKIDITEDLAQKPPKTEPAGLL